MHGTASRWGRRGGEGEGRGREGEEEERCNVID